MRHGQRRRLRRVLNPAFSGSDQPVPGTNMFLRKPPEGYVQMGKHSHQFVETYGGPVAFGLTRDIDEASLIVYLQKFSDDRLLEMLRGRLSEDEIRKTADWIVALLRAHLSQEEYHRLFLRDSGGCHHE